MANICDNSFKIYFEGEELKKSISNKLDELFKNELIGEIAYEDEGLIEGFFDSKWCFPNEIFEKFFDEFDDDSIEMICLSTEWSLFHIELNIYRNKKWEESQYFKV